MGKIVDRQGHAPEYPMTGKNAVHIIANASVSFRSMGGSDKIFIELARVWQRQGRAVTVWGCAETGQMCRRSGIGALFRQISSYDVERLGLARAYTQRTLSALCVPVLAQEGIIYSSSDFYPDLICALWQKIRSPRMRWCAGLFLIARSPFICPPARTLRGSAYWLMQRLGILLMRLFADSVIVLCAQDREFLARFGICERRVTVIAGGIDREAIEKTEMPLKRFDGCFLGRFHEQKGLPLLIDIWAKVTKKIPRAQLAIIGWGEQKQCAQIRELVRARGLEGNVHFLGFLDNEDKYRALKESRIFLFTSSYESWGIVIAEAMGCGLPVVAFDIPATRKFCRGIDLVAYPDTDAFAKATLDLLESGTRFRRLAGEALDYARSFRWEDSAERIERTLAHA